MADKAKSFILAPSRLGRNPTESEDSHATAKPNFTGGLLGATQRKVLTDLMRETFPGLKESKLGILAESKLTPSSGAVSVTTDKAAPAADDKKVPHTFNFAPLSKPSAEEVAKEKTADEENKNPNLEEAASAPVEKSDSGQFVFGQNLNARVENVSEEAGKAKNGKSEVEAEEQKEDEEGSPVESQSQESSKTDLLFTNSVSPSTKNGESN